MPGDDDVDGADDNEDERRSVRRIEKKERTELEILFEKKVAQIIYILTGSSLSFASIRVTSSVKFEYYAGASSSKDKTKQMIVNKGQCNTRNPLLTHIQTIKHKERGKIINFH